MPLPGQREETWAEIRVKQDLPFLKYKNGVIGKKGSNSTGKM